MLRYSCQHCYATFLALVAPCDRTPWTGAFCLPTGVRHPLLSLSLLSLLLLQISVYHCCCCYTQASATRCTFLPDVQKMQATALCLTSSNPRAPSGVDLSHCEICTLMDCMRLEGSSAVTLRGCALSGLNSVMYVVDGRTTRAAVKLEGCWLGSRGWCVVFSLSTCWSETGGLGTDSWSVDCALLVGFWGCSGPTCCGQSSGMASMASLCLTRPVRCPSPPLPSITPHHHHPASPPLFCASTAPSHIHPHIHHTLNGHLTP